MANRFDRAWDQMRPVSIVPHFTKHAEGSVLYCQGDTKVIVTCSVIKGVPRFLNGDEEGWVTAEYGMLPRSTGTRMEREAAKGKQSGRTQEIQRLIGRSLRAVVDRSRMPGYTLHIDCDVIQADGGTRCASITGAWVAMRLAVDKMLNDGLLLIDPIIAQVSAISVGVVDQDVVLDLDYEEDSQCDTDMNVVLTSLGGFVEVQGTAEGKPFGEQAFQTMLHVARQGNSQLQAYQREALVQAQSLAL